MDDGRIPKDVLYGELANGARARGRPTLRYKDTYKRVMRDAKININAWEGLPEDRRTWKSAVQSGVEETEADRMEQLVQKRAKRKEISSSSTATGFVCCTCSRDCHSLAYTATPESATLELPCAAIVFRDGGRPAYVLL